ncbi:MAG: hypothetical protein LBT04_05260 [Prevotellaceae bacterium]|jgi:hypothetical protein|nr:hypothetical protein [Prevotellaceae bacterium]
MLKKLVYLLVIAATFAACNGTTPSSVKGITLSSNSLEMFFQDKATLTATLSPAGVTGVDVIWTSSDESIAKVSKGVITANDSIVGECLITAKAADFTATCTVKVISFFSKLTASGLLLFEFDTINPTRLTSPPALESDTTLYHFKFYLLFQGLKVTDNGIDSQRDRGILMELEAVSRPWHYTSNNAFALLRMVYDYTVENQEVVFTPTLYTGTNAWTATHDWRQGTFDFDKYLEFLETRDETIEYWTGGKLYYAERQADGNFGLYVGGAVKSGSFSLLGAVDENDFLIWNGPPTWSFTCDIIDYDTYEFGEVSYSSTDTSSAPARKGVSKKVTLDRSAVKTINFKDLNHKAFRAVNFK